MDIIALLQYLKPLLTTTTIRQFSHIILTLFAMTGWVTVLGISRWAGARGGKHFRRALKGLWTPARDHFDVILPADLGLGFSSTQHFEHDLDLARASIVCACPSEPLSWASIRQIVAFGTVQFWASTLH